MMYRILLLCSLVFTSQKAFPQMQLNGDTLYGNEWIDVGQSYYKIRIGADGLYRIPYALLHTSGIPVAEIAGHSWQLFCRGQEVALFVSSGDTPLQPGDFLEFYGTQNRGELDHFLFPHAEREQLNPQYSMFSDTSVYFLTWGKIGKRTAHAIPDVTAQLQQPTSIRTLAEWVETESSNLPPTVGTYPLYGHYKTGEGYGTPRTLRIARLLPLPGLLREQEIQVHVRLSSWPGNNRLQFLVNGQIQIDSIVRGPSVESITWVLPPGTLINPELHLEIRASVQVSVATIQITYTQQIQAGSIWKYPFLLEPGATAGLYALDNQPGILLNRTKSCRVPGVLLGDKIVFPLSHSVVSDTLYFIPEQEIRMATALIPFQHHSFLLEQPDYLLITSTPFLEGTAQAYAAYRKQSEGGGFNPLLIDLATVQDYFAYGVDVHPIGIRNLVHYLKQRTSMLRYVLLIGKGLEYPAYRKMRVKPPWLIPAFGAPASDNLFVTWPGAAAPHTPIGRVAATEAPQVAAYLHKVQQLESWVLPEVSASDRGWAKRILHLAGGQTSEEKTYIRNYLDRAAVFLREAPLGGLPYTFYKTSVGGALESPVDSIARIIKDGVGILTFFGHSGANTFDFSINEPGTFQNTGRYPVVIALGCSAGQLFNSYRSLSEVFVFEPNQGAGAFIGTSSVGDLFALGDLLITMYQKINDPASSNRLGDILVQAFNGYAVRVSPFERALIQTTILHGDPALHLPFAPGPDFIIRPGSVGIAPPVISAFTDTVFVSAEIVNLGRGISDRLEVDVWIEHDKQERVLTVQQFIDAPAHKEAVRIAVPVHGIFQAGTYRLSMQLDPRQVLEEWPEPEAENNNTYGESGLIFPVFSTLATPVFPAPYGVVNQEKVTLLAAPSNSLSVEATEFRFEVDTTAQFNSPAFRDTVVSVTGGFFRWALPFSLIPGKTYFWRIASIGTVHQSAPYSFTYSKEPVDWKMQHFEQFTDCRFDRIRVDTANRVLELAEQVFSVRAMTGRFPDITRPEIAINNIPSRFFPFNVPPFDAGFYVAVFDGKRGEPWDNVPGGRFGSLLQAAYHPALIDFHVFPFPTSTAAQRRRLIDFLKDSIPPGNYVLLMSVADGKASLAADTWQDDMLPDGSTLFELLEQQGARAVRTLIKKPYLPYLLFYRKDMKAYPVSEAVAAEDAVLSQFWTIRGQGDKGMMESPPIGPAKEWEALYWDPVDTFALEVWGRDLNGQQVCLAEQVHPGKTNLQHIDASAFPVLSIRYRVEHATQRAIQAGSWGVQYTRYPDFTITGSVKGLDSVVQGKPYRLALEVRNLGGAIDTVVSVRCVVSQGNAAQYVHTQAVRITGTTMPLQFELPTAALEGVVYVRIEVNPEHTPAEEVYSNNLGWVTLRVFTDQSAPVLNVTFDGRSIAPGALVGSTPEIRISLRDDNLFPLLSDTTLLEVFLGSPNASVLRRCYFGEELTFYPAEEGGIVNEAQVVFQPYLAQSGRYILLVRGRDVRGNTAVAYQVSFEVIHQRQLLRWAGFPNPFADEVRFGYYMSGDRVPASYSVRIYAADGRLVRVLTALELGPLQLGNHTTWGWDGKDAAGVLLPNGTYFCQVSLEEGWTVQPRVVKVLLLR